MQMSMHSHQDMPPRSGDRAAAGIELLSTCPPRRVSTDSRSYLQHVIDVAHWSEEAGYEGILVYTANAAQADPWILAQIILQNTKALCPLVAVQPVYMHPYTVAKLIASLGTLYNRRIDLNMVAGGFRNDLTALNDTTPHDARYARLVEYTSIIKGLLSSPSAISFTGSFYSIDHLRLEPALPIDLMPRIFISGSSEAGVTAARKCGAVAVRYPGRFDRNAIGLAAGDPIDSGVRVGIIAREQDDHAWTVARKRFSEDRKGQVTHMLAMSATDSVWHKRLSEAGSERAGDEQSPYWLGPFENYKEYCPYLVGSYSRVGEEIAKHIGAGHTAFILDVPPDGEESAHVNRAFERAIALSGTLAAG
jgi:alkanesulfonate monooxygenase